MTRNIVTRYVYTTRLWEADYDDPEGLVGSGWTEAEALEDLECQVETASHIETTRALLSGEQK